MRSRTSSPGRRRQTETLQRCACAVIESMESRVLMSATARPVLDIQRGSASGMGAGGSFSNPIALGAEQLFAGNDGIHGSQLWIASGSPIDRARMLTDIHSAEGDAADPHEFTPGPAGIVYFVAHNGDKEEIFKTNGTEAGTVQVSSTPVSPEFLHYYNGRLFFGLSQREGIYALNDAGAQATVSTTLSIETWVGDVGANTVFGAKSSAGRALYASDGGAANFIIDPVGSGTASFKKGLALNGELIFGMSSDGRGDELWRTSGTVNSTALVKDIWTEPSSGSNPDWFTLAGNEIYFSANGGPSAGWTQIYKTDGTIVTKVSAIPDTETGTIRQLINANGTLYFEIVSNGASGVVKLAGSGIARPTTPASGTRFPASLTAVGSTVYFTAEADDGIRYLFQSDGSTVSKVGGDAGVNPSALTVVAGTLVYAGSDTEHGRELHLVSNTGGGGGGGDDDIGIEVFDFDDGATVMADEGSRLDFHVALNGITNVKKIYWDLADDRGLHVGTGETDHALYRNNLEDNDPQLVRVKVIKSDGTSVSSSRSITILNVEPRIKGFNLTSNTTTYEPVTGSFKLSDPGPDDAKDLGVSINWGDGTSENAPAHAGDFPYSHTFASFGRKTVRVEVVDPDGEKSVRKTTIDVEPLAEVDDPSSPFDFTIGGTNGNDRVKLAKSTMQPSATGDRNFYDLFVNGALIETLSLGIDDGIYVQLGEGNDRFEIDESLRASVTVYGGLGNDSIWGAAGADKLVGGPGSDKLYGRGGKNKIKA